MVFRPVGTAALAPPQAGMSVPWLAAASHRVKRPPFQWRVRRSPMDPPAAQPALPEGPALPEPIAAPARAWMAPRRRTAERIRLALLAVRQASRWEQSEPRRRTR